LHEGGFIPRSGCRRWVLEAIRRASQEIIGSARLNSPRAPKTPRTLRAARRKSEQDIIDNFDVHKEAMSVYRSAYHEIMKMMEDNLLSAFKCSSSYKTLAGLSTLAENGGLKVRYGMELQGGRKS